MFTLSFYHNDSTDKYVVAANRYSVSFRQGMTIISIDPIEPETVGIDCKLCRFEPSERDRYFSSVYITNGQGKTIDHYDAPKEQPAGGHNVKVA